MEAISISFLIFLSVYTWVRINISFPRQELQVKRANIFKQRACYRSIAIRAIAVRVESSLCEVCERGLRAPGDDAPRVKLHRYAAASARHVAARPIAARVTKVTTTM